MLNDPHGRREEHWGKVMRRAVWLPTFIVIGLVAVAGGGWLWWHNRQEEEAFVGDFPVDRGTLSAAGRNLYFVLEPGYQLHYQGGGEDLVITVLDNTELIDGVTTGVVEERETRGGALAEVSRNYYAIDPATRDVYYFGEEVDEYAGERVASHNGAWRSGAAGARFGLMMPGEPRVGQKHYQEIAPDVALDRAEIVSTAESIDVPAGVFQDVLKVRETTPLEPGVADKYYAPGIGMVIDGNLALVNYSTMR
jgi:hypothetical protein